VFMVAGIALYVYNPDIAILGGRFRGLLGNPNGMGTMLTLLAPLAFLLFKRYNYQLKDLSSYWLFGLSFIICLILCGSRTALIAIFLLGFFLRIRILSNVVTILLFVSFLLTYDLLLSSLPVVAQMAGLEEYFRLDTLDEGSGRFLAWNFAWQQINDVFFLGGGFGYTEYIYKLNSTMLSMLGHQGNAHNSYLTLWLDTGLIGIILLFIGFVQTIVKANRVSHFTLPIFYAVFISANFESWLAASLNPFTSLFLVIVSLLLINNQDFRDDQVTADLEAGVVH
jgi:O-antigen ligase